MAAYAADGFRVGRLLGRLRRIEETYRSTLDGIDEQLRSGRTNKWNAQLATNYHRGLYEATVAARETVEEELDENVVATLSGPPQQFVYATGAELSRILDAAADLDMEASVLREALICEHELVEEDQSDGGVSRRCENCALDTDTLDELGLPYDTQVPCRICGERGGDGTRLDNEGDLVPCYECTVGGAA